MPRMTLRAVSVEGSIASSRLGRSHTLSHESETMFQKLYAKAGASFDVGSMRKGYLPMIAISEAQEYLQKAIELPFA